MSEAILVVDESGIIRYTSTSGRRSLGIRRPTGGPKLLDNVHLDDRATVQRLLVQARQRPHTTIRDEIRLRGATGGYLLIAVSVTDQRSHAGIRRAGAQTYRDVSEHHAFEQKLRHLALHDGRTGLANRVLLQDRVTPRLGCR